MLPRLALSHQKRMARSSVDRSNGDLHGFGHESALMLSAALVPLYVAHRLPHAQRRADFKSLETCCVPSETFAQAHLIIHHDHNQRTHNDF